MLTVKCEILKTALDQIASMPHPTWCKSRQGGKCGCSISVAVTALKLAEGVEFNNKTGG